MRGRSKTSVPLASRYVKFVSLKARRATGNDEARLIVVNSAYHKLRLPSLSFVVTGHRGTSTIPKGACLPVLTDEDGVTVGICELDLTALHILALYDGRDVDAIRQQALT